MLALGINTQREIMTLLSITMASFAIALPVSVAAIGPFEGAVRISGQAVGIGTAVSVSLGFLFHGVFISVLRHSGRHRVAAHGRLAQRRDEHDLDPRAAAAGGPCGHERREVSL